MVKDRSVTVKADLKIIPSKESDLNKEKLYTGNYDYLYSTQ